MFFEAGAGQGAQLDVVQQQQRGLPLPQAKKVYLVKPEAGEPDKFILGIVKALATHPDHADWPGVKMQFFQLPSPEADPYTCRYIPVHPVNLQNDHYPWCSVEAMQTEIQCKIKYNKTGNATTLELKKSQVVVAKSFAERFANAQDLQDRPCERPVSQEAMNKSSGKRKKKKRRK